MADHQSGPGGQGGAGDGVGIGVIGGSGLYQLLQDAREVDVATPYGPPSGTLTVGMFGGRRVAFLPRHGAGHVHPPHLLPYRANLWALRSLGVRQVLAPGAVGALRAELAPGTFLVPDQLIDRTSGRAATYVETGHVAHAGFAEPYCPHGRAALAAAARGRGVPTVDAGTLVVINGPRFSTRAESRANAAAGGDVVGMTGMPEAVLARELAVCYSAVCIVTDADAGVEGAGVTHTQVLDRFAASLADLREVLTDAVGALPRNQQCSCADVWAGVEAPVALPVELPVELP